MNAVRMDARLVRRQRIMTEVAERQPAATFPDMFPERKDLEGSYDMFSNENVNPDGLLQDHIHQTVERCERVGDIIVACDSTDLRFGGQKRRGLGNVGPGHNGFWLHGCLALSAVHERHALGVLNAQFWVRPERRRKERKQSRTEIRDSPENEFRVWMNGVTASEAAIAGRARAIYTMDRGADGYELLAELAERGVYAVVRSRFDRVVVAGDAKRKMSEVISAADTLLQREVQLSARKKSPFPKGPDQPRASRIATLRISCTPITIPKTHRARPGVAREVLMTAVHVVEQGAPENTDAVEWVLLTNLPVTTAEEAACVVDAYRARWVIEEYWKALKTGCAPESRQLETAHSLINMTAFFLPIAAKVLELRSHARTSPDAPANTVCTQEELDTLAHISPQPLPPRPKVKDIMLAIAKLGGHLKSNGDPGWAVLMRGWAKLAQFMTLHKRLHMRRRSPES